MKTLLSLLLLYCVFALSSCFDTEENRTPPVLKNLVVEFADYDPATEFAGDFTFRDNFERMFFEFGYRGSADPGDLVAEFAYIVKEDALLKAPCDGIITRLEKRSDGDYYIIIQSKKNSHWFTQVDHVLNVTVKKGDEVKAGDVLGNPGNWNNSVGLGVVELSVINDKENKNYCPFSYFDPVLRPSYEAKVQKLMDDWEDYKGDENIYSDFCIDLVYDVN